MEQMIAAVVGGLFGEDGISAFSRPVLFGTAGDAVRLELADAVHKRYFIRSQEEPCIDGMEEIPLCGTRFDALRALPEGAHVLVLDRPLVLSRQGMLERLLATHMRTGYDVTVLAAQQGAYDEDGEPLPADGCAAAVFTRAALEQALRHSVNTLDAFVDAALEAGAQRGMQPQDGDVIAITDGKTAYLAQNTLKMRINMEFIEHGVQIFEPAHTYIAPDACVQPGAVILPGCHIRSGCRIEAGAVIGPNTILEQASIGAHTTVNNSQVYQSTIGAHATVGPFAYIRPQCVIGDRTRIGDFVELKKATIGDDTKVSHLTYIGDAQVGARVNFGCGTVVVNYDGYHKTQTVIGDDCFIGCNTNLISPVTLGERVFTAAGSTVTKDVESGALAIARAKQTNIEGWNDRRRAAHQKPASHA